MKFSTALIAALASVAPVFAKNITVVVGADAAGAPALTFNPQNIQAAVGDFINFEFRGGNHTVTQSSFASAYIHKKLMWHWYLYKSRPVHTAVQHRHPAKRLHFAVHALQRS